MRTFLYDEHVRLHAKMVDFAGFEMPLQYTSIVQEHKRVRNFCGLFDLSHMALFEVGQIDHLVANHLPKEPYTSTYAVMCNPEGGCIDDLIIYKWNDTKFWVIGNAANREADAERFGAQPLDLGILAVQGPGAPQQLNVEFKKNHFEVRGDLVFAATGYTGEMGFEIVGPKERLKELFLKLISHGVPPCGLGCRDTLRLEMGYALYGHELTQDISPLESVAAWTVKLDKEFQGKEACIRRAHRKAYGIELVEKGVPRAGYRVFKNNRPIGVVTSGTFAPTLQRGIALILVEEEVTDRVEIEIREERVAAHVVPLPFYKRI